MHEMHQNPPKASRYTENTQKALPKNTREASKSDTDLTIHAKKHKKDQKCIGNHPYTENTHHGKAREQIGVDYIQLRYNFSEVCELRFLRLQCVCYSGVRLREARAYVCLSLSLLVSLRSAVACLCVCVCVYTRWSSACMCACVYVCMHVCMYVCMYV